MDLPPQKIPIIDMALLTADPMNPHCQALSSACTQYGCFYLTNHGVPSTTLDELFRDLRTFFSQPVDYKLQHVDPNGNLDRGYEPFATRNVNAFMGRMGLPNDPVEKYAFGPPPVGFPFPISDNIWPSVPPTLKKSVEDYYLKIRDLSNTLMRLFSTILTAPDEDFFYSLCGNGEHILRANFYPRHASPKHNQSTRFGEHTDGTPFTILAMDECISALQVQNHQGEWIYADPVPGALFINLGDFMARWTNDKWKACVHRVLWAEKESSDRLSLAYFLQMNPGAVIECLPSCVEQGERPKYEPILHSEYVKKRMDRLSGRAY